MTMQPNDRELLEMAAKAVEYELGWDARGAFVLPAGVSGSDTLWNPLTDDGDALRLAVKLHMSILSNETASWVAIGKLQLVRAEELNADSDPYAATRRAIVRAAAEIGRSMT